MHFSIPDTQDFDGSGVSYTGYNVHVNGVFHCTVRYRQFHSLYERIKKDFPTVAVGLPKFPPKKLLPLSIAQLEERRLLLQKYLEAVGQNPSLANSELFHEFLLSAQQSTSGIAIDNATVDVFLTNGLRFTLDIMTNHRSDQILWQVCEKLGLPKELSTYFCLFLENYENGEYSLHRRLLDFESPYIALNMPFTQQRIILRKSYWDPNLDLIVMENKIGLNLLYLQTVSDVEHGWVVCSKEHLSQLAVLQSQGAKRQYMDLARTLKFYGYLQFNQCICDYPYPGSRVLVSAGNRELNLRVRLTEDDDVRTGSFKVTRMRCWRITTLHGQESNEKAKNLEMSFEYLMARDKLQWITIVSDQAVLMSMCLQSMVEELLDDSRSKNGKSTDTSSSSETNTPSTSGRGLMESMQNSEIRHSTSFNQAKALVSNECFDNDGIGDDDL